MLYLLSKHEVNAFEKSSTVLLMDPLEAGVILRSITALELIETHLDVRFVSGIEIVWEKVSRYNLFKFSIVFVLFKRLGFWQLFLSLGFIVV